MDEYFLQVVKDDEAPKWPHSQDELVVGKQSLSGGFTQHWAYLAESGKEAEDLPPAEILASENKTSAPAILIDQKTPTLLNIVLVKDGHAWAHTDSDEKNLEESISEMLSFAKEKYGLQVEHFMTTGRVAPEVEERLDKLEQNDVEEPKESKESEESEIEEEKTYIKPVARPDDFTELVSGRKIQPPPKGNLSKVVVILPLVLILVLFGGAVKYKDKILGKISSFNQPAAPVVTITPTSAPTPTPTPSLDRSQYKVRVLNGTTKTGAAGTLAEELESQGWEILSKGNAKNQATPQTTISVKEGTEDLVLQTMISDLKDYEATQGADLSSKDKADVEVVIGKR